MSKSVTTRWYIGAWIVALVCAVVFVLTAHAQTSGGGATPAPTSPIAAIAWIVGGVCSLVMLVMWIGALVRLGQLGRWSWFVAVLMLHVLWLGVVAMVAYATTGPEDAAPVTRPSVT